MKKNHNNDKCIEALRPSNKNNIADLMTQCKLQVVDGHSLSVQKWDENLTVISHATTNVQVCGEKIKVLDISTNLSLKVNRTYGYVSINHVNELLTRYWISMDLKIMYRWIFMEFTHTEKFPPKH